MNESQAMVTIASTLASPDMQKQIQTLLPKNIPLDKFTEVTLMAIRKTPEVLEADRQTLYDACLSLARRGLLPDKKEAALVVFPTNIGTREQPKWIKVVQEMAMIEGIIKEMAKAGIKAYAVSVYANELPNLQFWNDDFGQHVKHIPIIFGDRGERMGSFAAASTPDGRTYVEGMNMAELEKTALRSKQAKKDKNGNKTRGGTWLSDPERMEQKTPMHRLRKRIPILDTSDALQNLKDFEDESDIELEPQKSQPESAAPSLESGSPEPNLGSRGVASRPRALQSVVDQVKAVIAEPQNTVLSNIDSSGEYQGEDII